MAGITRLSGCSEWIDLLFVECERTPHRLMELGIRLHLAGLSLSNTVKERETFGVQRSRKAVHDWVQKADLQPVSGTSPNKVAVDETVIRINDQQYWLYAAVNPETNKLLHVRLFFPPRPHSLRSFSASPERNTMSTTHSFSSMPHHISNQHFTEQDSDFSSSVTGIGTVSNVYFVR